MALGDTVSITSVQTELGISTPDTVSGLNTYGSLNHWSFFKPILIQPNASTKIVETVTDTSPYNFGDFRRYNHSASAPYVQADHTQNYNPNPSNNPVTFTISFINNELNVKEVDNSITHLFVKVFSDVGRTTQIASKNVPIQFNTITPPAGHKNNQIQQPNSTQLITGITITSPNTYDNTTIYLETWLSDVGETLRARLTDHVTDIFWNQYQQPNLSFSTTSYSPNPFPDSDSSHNATAVFANNSVKSNVAGDTSWNFSFKVAAIWGSSGVQERVSGTVQVKYHWAGTDYNIGSTRAFSEGDTISVTDSISGGISSLSYDDNITIKLVFTSLATTYNAI